MIKQRYLIILILLFNTYFINAFFDTFELIKNQNAVVIGEGLRLRKEPNANSQILYRFSFGEEIKVIEVKQDKYETINDIINYWVKVETNNIIGWVFGAYIAYPYYRDGDELIAITFPAPILKIYNGKSLIASYRLTKEINYKEAFEYHKIGWINKLKEPDKYFDIRIMRPYKIVLETINNKKVININGYFKEDVYGMGEGRAGFITDLWFSFNNNKIKPIFNNIKIQSLTAGYSGSLIAIRLIKDQTNDIKEIEQIYDYIPISIDYDYFNNMIKKLDEIDKEKIMKYYYREEIPKLLTREVGLKILTEENIFTREESKIFHNFYGGGGYNYNEENKSISIHGGFEFCELYNENNLTEKNKELLKKILKKTNYNWSYIFNQNMPNDQLDEAREILQKVGYEFKDYKFTYKWNGEEFIIKDKIFPQFNLIDSKF
ncbi:MAG: hypothetical protein A2086_07015 [Spirochaetes bacterium GWD1_27_9]|nr:MAG: hypothetical protein A2Z98_15645 [Spirochaetes bacterium GWB1_27_13]OHD26398.1 MAG: hypothetical protein A2Y34_14870 [Spirochaetes bacterium GWC1_27_15]OHD44447.1 MAG: hypothetical protein A2086_07015 [Spirochaetes bacterium GWD1_27_9]